MRNLRLAAAGVATAGVFAGAWAAPAAAGAAAAPSAPHARPAAVAAFRSTSGKTTVLKTRKIKSVTVLTNSNGRTLYWFAPDTSSMSRCNGSCAQIWPPVPGPAHASGASGKFSTITRSGGSKQATYRGHPLYTYVGDTKAGQNKGNGLNAEGGLWHEMTTSGSTTGAKPSSGQTGGGYGY
jgi:predicted lipoprotein with Yx(FWY)xxD motif